MSDIDWDITLHREVIEMMHRLEESLDEENESDEPRDVETPSGWPYCGCEDCLVREILTVAVPRIVEAYQQGLVDEKALKPGPPERGSGLRPVR